MIYLPYAIIFGLAAASFMLRKLTLAATVAAIVVAIFIFWGAGAIGLIMLGTFFVLGVAATSWHKKDKETFKTATDQGNRRNYGQVLANGGVAAVCGLLAYLSQRQVFGLMMAGSLAAGTADTLSSELGMVYGRSFYNVLNFKPDKKGEDGVVSLEGTIIGLTGAVVIAVIDSHFWPVLIAGVAGNYIDSLLGATLERKRLLNNNMVNLFCTLTGALVATALTALSF